MGGLKLFLSAADIKLLKEQLVKMLRFKSYFCCISVFCWFNSCDDLIYKCKSLEFLFPNEKFLKLFKSCDIFISF